MILCEAISHCWFVDVQFGENPDANKSPKTTEQSKPDKGELLYKS